MSALPLAPVILQATLLTLLIGYVAFEERINLPRLKRHTSTAARLSAYRMAIASMCTFTLVAFALVGSKVLYVAPNAPDELAFLLDNRLVYALAIIVLIAYFCLAFAPAIHCAVRADARQTYASAFRSLRFMLPVSTIERRWWVAVCVSAGVCEEVLFRGFMLNFIQGQSHAVWQLNLTAAWLISSFVFGCCHAYQGVGGVVRTTLGGLIFGLLAIVTGNLFASILLHALVDLAVLLGYQPGTDDPTLAQALQQGCDPSQDLAPAMPVV